MAEGVLKYYGGDKFEVESAGSKPSSVNKTAIRVMKELGIDISDHRSKSVKEFLPKSFDYVITVCETTNESCPIFPGSAIRFHWPFPDPPHDKGESEEVLNEFRKVRDLIHSKFKEVALVGF